MTGAVMTETIRAYTALVSTYKKHQDVKDCLKKLLVTAVPPIYLKPLRNRHTGLSLVTCKAIVTHLCLSSMACTPRRGPHLAQQLPTKIHGSQP
jgi:hypothetical protein